MYWRVAAVLLKIPADHVGDWREMPFPDGGVEWLEPTLVGVVVFGKDIFVLEVGYIK